MGKGSRSPAAYRRVISRAQRELLEVIREAAPEIRRPHAGEPH
jgi:hypothetical protein